MTFKQWPEGKHLPVIRVLRLQLTRANRQCRVHGSNTLQWSR